MRDLAKELRVRASKGVPPGLYNLLLDAAERLDYLERREASHTPDA